ncbi:MAG: IS91 family transposase [Planctomycetia bacterium]|nr:IS91 family transposase [Planctomycetia bacterium]
MTSPVGPDATPPQRPAWEVADVIRLHGEAFLATHGLNAEQRRTLYDLADCRTAALGGHVQRCLDCGHERIAYNSCRNRHCPKCQALARARWLEREAKLLLPVEYHHVVFTLPAEVAELALANPAVMYNALFQAASATLRDVAANPKRLGAQVGILMVLHTWGQNLHHHPHVHAVVTGGGLSCNIRSDIDASPAWRSCRPGFFLPVRVLSRVFRGKYLALLKAAFERGQLAFPGRLAFLKDPDAFNGWLRPLYAKDWVVYAKPPFGGPAQVLKYLARYTHRVAISNSRIVDVKDGRVTFRYKDYADDHRSKTMTVSADEFLRRFVQHVLPRSFVKVRHYGLLANRHRAEKLKTCRRLLLPIAVTGTTPPSAAATIAPLETPCCPKCGGCRLVRMELPKEPPRPLTPPPAAASSDTS